LDLHALWRHLLLLLLLFCVFCVAVAELLHHTRSRRWQRALRLRPQACLRLSHHLCWDAAFGQRLLELIYHDALPWCHTPVGALQLVGV
jgi:hypothetical protein